MHRPVRYRGREYPVIERFHIGRKPYLAVARLASGDRQRYQVFDPTGRAMRVLQRLPGSRETEQRLRVLQALNDGNPELPQVLEFHRDGEDMWVVLPWVEGHNLRTYLTQVRRQRAVRRISAPEAVRLLRGLAHALAHLHRRNGIIHGDIKPANLILTNRTRLVLIDYGSAWPVERTTSRTGGDGSNAAYSAPEMLADGRPVNFQADYFSVCVVLYELLTLAIPYDGLGGGVGRSTSAAKSESLLVPPSELCRDTERLRSAIRSRVDSLVCRGLKVEARDRFETSADWLNAWDELMLEMRRPADLLGISRSVLRLIDWFRSRFGKDHR